MGCFTLITSQRCKELQSTPTELGSSHLLGFFFSKFILDGHPHEGGEW